MIYYICDNRNSPYAVIIHGTNVYVYSTETKKLIKHIPDATEIFPGKALKEDSSELYGKKYTGAEILVSFNVPNHYMLIGSEIIEFDTFEKITDFVSNIGNNLVTYSYAISDNNYYLFSEKRIVPKEEIPKNETKNLYTYYY